MAQRIQFRRGTNAARQTIVPNAGEPVWTTDTNSLYVGDGLTTGGISAGGFPDSENYIMVQVTDSESSNGQALLDAYATARAATPYSKPLSEYNPMTILLPGSVYDLGNTGIIASNGDNWIGFYGLDRRENVIIKGSPRQDPTSNHAVQGILLDFAYNNTGINFENLTLLSINTGWGVNGYRNNQTNRKIKFDNVSFIYSGVLGTGAPVVQIGGGVGGIFNGVGVYASNSMTDHTFNNCFFSGSFAVADAFNITLNNCTFNNKLACAFGGATTERVRLNNCSFIGKSGLTTSAINITDIQSNFIVQNSFFSGQNSPAVLIADGSHSCVGLYKDCVFLDAYIQEFEGIMENCYLESNKAGSPIIQNNNAFGDYARLYNCTLINNSSFPSTISGSENLVLAHCRLNKNITGMTQLLGSTGFSIVSTNITST